MTKIIDKFTGKEVRVTHAEIRVSSNERCEDGVFVEVRMTAVFPGCRKVAVVSISPMGSGVGLKSLYGYSGEAHVEPEEWRTFLRSLPVVSDDLFPVEMTPELAAYAVAHEERTADAVYAIQKHDQDLQAQLWGDGPTPAMAAKLGYDRR